MKEKFNQYIQTAKQVLRKYFTQNNYRNCYALIIVLVAGSYYFVREFIIDQSAWSITRASQLTVNMLLLYFLWGYYIERKLKKQPQWKRLSIDFAGFLVITFVYRYGFGMPTILG